MSDAPTPNEALARRVAARLAAERVIAVSGVDAVARRLAAGDMKQRDWEALVDGGASGTSPDAPTRSF